MNLKDFISENQYEELKEVFVKAEFSPELPVWLEPIANVPTHHLEESGIEPRPEKAKMFEELCDGRHYRIISGKENAGLQPGRDPFDAGLFDDRLDRVNHLAGDEDVRPLDRLHQIRVHRAEIAENELADDLFGTATLVHHLSHEFAIVRVDMRGHR